jgi:hypothetical protein
MDGKTGPLPVRDAFLSVTSQKLDVEIIKGNDLFQNKMWGYCGADIIKIKNGY